MENKRDNNMYLRFALMIAISYVSMYALMYSMVNEFSNIYPNLNQFYMVNLMTAPMIVAELIIMRGMYKSKILSMTIIALTFVCFLLSLVFIRKQTLIGDKQFLLSMIPHHSGAILMCEEASLDDPEIKDLCDEIIQNQREEIDQMEQLLDK